MEHVRIRAAPTVGRVQGIPRWPAAPGLGPAVDESGEDTAGEWRAIVLC